MTGIYSSKEEVDSIVYEDWIKIKNEHFILRTSRKTQESLGLGNRIQLGWIPRKDV